MAQQAERVDDRIDGLKQITVMRGGIDRLMQLAVDEDELLRIALGATFGSRNLEQTPDLGLGGMLCGERSRGAFERLADGVKLDQLPGIEIGHHHAAPRTVREQSLRDKAVKRLAHRRAADTQPLRHICFAQMLFWPELTGTQR